MLDAFSKRPKSRVSASAPRVAILVASIRQVGQVISDEMTIWRDSVCEEVTVEFDTIVKTQLRTMMHDRSIASLWMCE